VLGTIRRVLRRAGLRQRRRLRVRVVRMNRCLRVIRTNRCLRVVHVNRCRRPPRVRLLRPRPLQRASGCRRLFRNWLNIRRLKCLYRLADLPLNQPLSLRTHRSRRWRPRPPRHISRPPAATRPTRQRRVAAGTGRRIVAPRAQVHMKSRRPVGDRMRLVMAVQRMVAHPNCYPTMARLTGLAMGRLTMATIRVPPRH
jgi:hypothetical protein